MEQKRWRWGKVWKAQMATGSGYTTPGRRGPWRDRRTAESQGFSIQGEMDGQEPGYLALLTAGDYPSAAEGEEVLPWLGIIW